MELVEMVNEMVNDETLTNESKLLLLNSWEQKTSSAIETHVLSANQFRGLAATLSRIKIEKQKLDNTLLETTNQ